MTIPPFPIFDDFSFLRMDGGNVWDHWWQALFSIPLSVCGLQYFFAYSSSLLEWMGPWDRLPGLSVLWITWILHLFMFHCISWSNWFGMEAVCFPVSGLLPWIVFDVLILPWGIWVYPVLYTKGCWMSSFLRSNQLLFQRFIGELTTLVLRLSVYIVVL